MKKYAILSSNDNPTYLYYLPLVVWAWRKIGWDSAIFYHGESSRKLDLIYGTLDLMIDPNFRIIMIGLDDIEGHQSHTIAQVSRLYACCRIVPTHYLMTSDADILPLSDYWKVESKPLFTDRNGVGRKMMKPKPTAYGRDLTDYHYPMCFCGMLSSDWYELMQLTSSDHQAMMKRDMDSIHSRDGVWSKDQQILTERILEYGKERIKHVDRGTDPKTGYPKGRIDRSNWHYNHDQYIDAHLPHDTLTNDESFKKVLDLLHTVWPQQDWTWWIRYSMEFKKLL